MSANYAKHLSPLATPQTEQAHPAQTENGAGGFGFTVDVWQRLDRFLVLGNEGGSYYAGERAMTRASAVAVETCLNQDGARAVARIVEISDAGRAPKNDAAIFALAMAAAHDSPVTRKLALAALPKVCRIGTHLFHFARDVESFRRWGRGLRSAIAAWYNTQSPDALALQVTKYRQRDGWSHRDLLRLAHPKARTTAHNAVFRWVAADGEQAFATPTTKGAAPQANDLPALIGAFEQAQRATTKKEIVKLVRAFHLTHEMLPTQWKNELDVWDALLDDMPPTALVRNLAKMTEVGLLKPLSSHARRAATRLTDPAQLRRARLHPIALLAALKVYESGRGVRGSLTWTPVRQITDALDEAFYLAFDAIEPTGQNYLLALDVSGSMTCGTIAAMPGITPRIASAAMAMVTARAEQNWHVMGFSHKLVPIGVSPKQSLETVMNAIADIPMGGTDCALPMIHALEHGLEVDTFVVYTDNETWAGRIHPFQALRAYREKTGRAAKLIVVGMISNDFTIADPNDAGMLDVVGFDTATPALMADFSKS